MLTLPILIRDLVLFLAIALVTNLVARRLSIPYTLGLVVVGLVVGLFGLTPEVQLTPDLVLYVFLPALLFEGAWNVKLDLLRKNWRVIFFLAGPGLLISVVIIAALLHFIVQLDWMTAFLLAAILSPTDPVAVLGLFRQLHVNERLSNIIEGESLFNDGVAGSLYQVFLMFVLLGVHNQSLTGWSAVGTGLLQLLIEAGGGIAFGIIAGAVISQGLKRIDDPQIETTITLVAAYGVFWVADTIHLSAIITVIVLGLVLGNYGRNTAMSEATKGDVDTVWDIASFLGNALIFLLVGVQFRSFANIFLSNSGFITWFVALLAVGIVLLARFFLVFILAVHSWIKWPNNLFEKGRYVPRSWRLIIFWSGLRGALSLALALSIPLEVPARTLILVSTYAVVFFTLLVQGLSIRFVLKKALPSDQQQQGTTGPEDKGEQTEETVFSA
ncbi:Na+/H+ antiporter [Dictyobacter alpinus]|uniref:Na+/H+ antiporter n=1 Tax=Dictyobacter alpinus TaxID=2014873 RepID=A0A402BG16_9CHLR|nr:sodium:proton antiporter [Dictyobacter alpinus]GCE30324.1 Na+/H+ antiporter [Dictyobacter alpinus]GCE30356.1 Na+/H+ antiporter [Dictyobacter alpinus]